MVSPGEAVTVEDVVDCVVRSDCVGNAVGGFGTRECETATVVVFVVCGGGGGGGGVDGVEVEVDVAVEVVEIHGAVAVEFGDVEVRVRREKVLERFVEGVE